MHYFKISLRNIYRYKTYTLINITGLVCGLTCFILISLWVHDELSYDNFHDRAKNIYRVVFADETYDQSRNYRVTPPALAAALKENFPEVRHSAVLDMNDDMLVRYDQKIFKQKILFTDISAFSIFTFDFIIGDPKTALSKPFSVVINEKIAEKYFGSENPVNKTIQLNNRLNLTVTGVVKEFPQNSTLQFDLITRFEHYEELTGRGNINSWDNFGYNTFILLEANTNIADFNQKIAGFAINSHEYNNFKPRLFVQPFSEIYLYNLNGGGPIVFIYIFSIVAAFVLLIACINYMNLATARSVARSKEVGLRKVIGAKKSNLVKQFISESVLIAFVSLVLSLLLTESLLSVFNNLSGKNITLNYFSDPALLIFLISIAIITGFISGSYPALVLSSFKPVEIFKTAISSRSQFLRKALVIFQFSISILLITCTFIVSDQVDYLRNLHPGFDRDQIIYLPLNDQLKEKHESVRNELLKNPQIKQVTPVSSKLGIQQYYSIDLDEWEGNNQNRSLLLNVIFAGVDFTETFNINIKKGRSFSSEFVTDQNAVLLNEAAINAMGMNEPIGKQVSGRFHIVGVINDFNFTSLHDNIEPLAILMNPQNYYYLAIKIQSNDIPGLINYLENIYHGYAPDTPFEYFFLDQEFDKLYRSEQRLGQLFNYFSIVAIIISCLGLIGLTAFIIQRRTKEIGIRKVLGAPVAGLLYLLTREFTRGILIATIIAWPLSWYIIEQWLENFAYRTDYGWPVFVTSGAIAFFIALISTGFLVIKAAYTNPVKVMRYE